MGTAKEGVTWKWNASLSHALAIMVLDDVWSSLGSEFNWGSLRSSLFYSLHLGRCPGKDPLWHSSFLGFSSFFSRSAWFVFDDNSSWILLLNCFICCGLFFRNMAIRVSASSINSSVYCLLPLFHNIYLQNLGIKPMKITPVITELVAMVHLFGTLCGFHCFQGLILQANL